MTRVLVADDDLDIRELVAAKLELAGFDVVALPDGREALATLRAGDIDLALLDISMAGATGIDVCRAVRADAEIARLPLILLSARAQESDVVAGLAAGANDYVIKPFSPRELLERVRAALGKPSA
jgi:two-component system response regulator MtrA